MKLFIEKYYPLGTAIVLTYLSAVFKVFDKNITELINQLADNALSISVTLFGFLLTILTLVNSIETRRMKFVREMGAFPRLLRYLRVSILSNLTLLVFSFIIKYITHREGVPNLYIKGYNIPDFIFLFWFLFTILASFRFTHIFISLLSDHKQK